MLDLHFVAPGLAVGARFPAGEIPRLARDHGISRVLDARVEACDDEADLGAHGIVLLHLPTEDTCAPPRESIRRAVTFVSEGLDRGERVLIHCQYGIGRSALLGLCVLVARGEAPLAAMERMKQARRVVSPSPAQLQALVSFAAALKAERGLPWRVPEVQELGAIAWRHLQEAGSASGEAARAASTRAA